MRMRMPGVIVDVLKRGYACSWRNSDPLGCI